MLIECACGCGNRIDSKDRYGRPRRYISGHNTERKYDDPTQFKREWNHRHRAERYAYKRKWLHELKVKLVLKLGGKCATCSYQFTGDNYAAFDFHHVDGANKLFDISSHLNKRSLKDVYAEVDKCVLLCAICHRLHHAHRTVLNTADPSEELQNSFDLGDGIVQATGNSG